jgi:nucleoside-diphosphate-sugar epimerase
MPSDYQVVRPTFEDIFGVQSDFARTALNDEPQSILITGAQGMLGNGLAQAFEFLQRNGALERTKVYLLSREWSVESLKMWKKNTNFQLVVNSDISNLRGRIEVAIHAASPSNITQVTSFEQLQDVNVGLLRKIQSLKPKRVVYISSGEVYRSEPPREGTHSVNFLMTNRRDWYPLAKLEAEFELEHFERQHNSSVSILRLFHTFGPGLKSDDGRSFADILWGAAVSGEIQLHSNGEQVRSFLYLSDAIDAIIKVALSAETGYKVVNLGSNEPLSIKEFAEKVQDLTGAEIRFKVDGNFIHSPNNYLVPIIQNMYLYNWFPKLEIGEGIGRTISWIRNSTLL